MLIDDLDKLINELGEKLKFTSRSSSDDEPSYPHSPEPPAIGRDRLTGMVPAPNDRVDTPIEPCTGLIDEYNTLLGDIYIPEDNNTKDPQ